MLEYVILKILQVISIIFIFSKDMAQTNLVHLQLLLQQQLKV